ncbi:MAG: lysophospholipid acyltransferase family protein [Vulcanimicrobiota bacterium]
MQIRAHHANGAPAQARPEYPPPPPENQFGLQVDNYTGPADGFSQMKHQWLLRPISKALVAMAYRVEAEGTEKVPHTGKHLYCPTHPTFFDPPVMAVLSDRDLRYVAAENVFDGLRGKVMSWSGAFPTDLNWGRMRTVRHAIDVVKQGKGLVIFPEGKISEDRNHVDRLKQGSAFIAHHSGAESIVPIAMDYVANDKPRTGERLAGWAAAALVAAGSVAAMAGDPLTRAVAGAITGGLTGLYGAGAAARALTPNPEWCDPFPKYFAGLKAGAAGLAAGALAGGVLGVTNPSSLAITGLTGAAATVGISEGWRNRPIARVKVGDPIPVSPYFPPGSDSKEGVRKLTEDLHQTLGALKADITGVPYDPQARKVFDRSVDPPVGVGWSLDGP